MCLVFLKTSGVSFNIVMLKEKRRGVCGRQTRAKPNANSDRSDTEGYVPHWVKPSTLSAPIGLRQIWVGAWLCSLLVFVWRLPDGWATSTVFFFRQTRFLPNRNAAIIFIMLWTLSIAVALVFNLYCQLLFLPLRVWHGSRFNIFRACVFASKLYEEFPCGAAWNMPPFFT